LLGGQGREKKKKGKRGKRVVLKPVQFPSVTIQKKEKKEESIKDRLITKFRSAREGKKKKKGGGGKECIHIVFWPNELSLALALHKREKKKKGKGGGERGATEKNREKKKGKRKKRCFQGP